MSSIEYRRIHPPPLSTHSQHHPQSKPPSALSTHPHVPSVHRNKNTSPNPITLNNINNINNINLGLSDIAVPNTANPNPNPNPNPSVNVNANANAPGPNSGNTAHAHMHGHGNGHGHGHGVPLKVRHDAFQINSSDVARPPSPNSPPPNHIHISHFNNLNNININNINNNNINLSVCINGMNPINPPIPKYGCIASANSALPNKNRAISAMDSRYNNNKTNNINNLSTTHDATK